MRKLWFSHLARALVVFPGGVGTLDELFEMLTLTQTRKLDARRPDRPLRLELLERSAELRGDGPPRDDRARRPGAVLVRGRSASRPRPAASEAAHPPGADHPRIREVAHSHPSRRARSLDHARVHRRRPDGDRLEASPAHVARRRAARLRPLSRPPPRVVREEPQHPGRRAGARRGGAVPRAHRPHGRATAARAGTSTGPSTRRPRRAISRRRCCSTRR